MSAARPLRALCGGTGRAERPRPPRLHWGCSVRRSASGFPRRHRAEGARLPRAPPGTGRRANPCSERCMQLWGWVLLFAPCRTPAWERGACGAVVHGAPHGAHRAVLCPQCLSTGVDVCGYDGPWQLRGAPHTAPTSTVLCRALQSSGCRGCCLRVFCGRALGHVVPRGAAAWGRKSPSVAPAASDTPSRFWRTGAGFAPQRCVWARAEHSARVGLREAVRAQPRLRAHRRPRASCSSSAALA